MANVWKKMAPTSADVTWGGKRKLAMPAYHTGNVLTRVKGPVKSPMNVDVQLAQAILMDYAIASSHLQIGDLSLVIWLYLKELQQL